MFLIHCEEATLLMRKLISVLRLNSNSSMESSRTRILDDDNGDDIDAIRSGNALRRKVTLDPGLLDDLLNFSDEDESEVEEEQLSRQGSLDSIMSHESRTMESPSKESSPEKTFKKGHQRRHSLTVCETPKRIVNNEQQSGKPRKPPQLVFETQTSTISTASTEGQSSDSVTPTSQYSTPKFEGGRSPSPALDESSLAQMQERLHAEFLQSVSLKQVYYLVDTVLENH